MMHAIVRWENGHILAIELDKRNVIVTNSGKEIYKDNVEYYTKAIVDLTEMFGKGNEPGLDELDDVLYKPSTYYSTAIYKTRYDITADEQMIELKGDEHDIYSES